MSLPIDAVLPELRASLEARPNAVVQAPPGAGKTTRVPPALLDAPWMEGRKLILLEPRRLAARAAADRMADLLGERTGETVGYRIRLDTKVSRRTRIEVVTEGVLTRMLQSDPLLEGVGAVVFDEYHERSLPADLGLALCLEAQGALRPDLRLLVMSATLDGAAVAALLGDAPTITSEGRRFPVETHYADRRPHGRIEGAVAATVRDALAAHEGDVLVFLPGAGEIRRTAAMLDDPPLPPEVEVMPLYGRLPRDRQDAAIRPSPPGRRKVVLATAIAETSLTIEGVRVVVDGGLMRVPRFSPRTGMTELATLPVSKASADQRRGRAGRLGPGACYRLWTAAEQQHLRPHSPPEIAEADLAPLALELAAWGTPDPAALRWLDPPPEAAYAQARDLLRWLGALDAEGRITPHGRRMAEVGLHPRLAHLLLKGDELGLGAVAADLAAVLSERDLFRSLEGVPDVDLRLRLEALERARDGEHTLPDYARGYHVDRGALRQALDLAAHHRRRLGAAPRAYDVEACGLLLAFAYPDRLAQRRPGQAARFQLRTGHTAVIPEPQLLSDAELIVVADLDGQARDGRIYQAAPVDRAALEAHFGEQVEEDDVVTWDADAARVRARRERRLGAVVLERTAIHEPDPEAVLAAFLDGVRQAGLDALPWTKNARRLQERLVFLHHHAPDDWPDATDDALLAALDAWLAPHVYGETRLDALRRLDVHQILMGRIRWDQHEPLDRLAPTHYVVPSGSRIPIDYSTPEAPVLAVRLQELFGATTTPRVLGGRVPLTLHLLSPAHRPVQVTQDLENFWADTYFDVKKDLKGRYPKHYWPDDPLQATPTNRAKPRK